MWQGRTNSALSFVFFTYYNSIKPTNLFITFNQGRLYTLWFNLVVQVNIMHFQEAKPIMSNTCDPPEAPAATHCFSCAACPYLLLLWSLPFVSFYKLKWSSMLEGRGSLLQLGHKKLKFTHDGGKEKLPCVSKYLYKHLLNMHCLDILVLNTFES